MDAVGKQDFIRMSSSRKGSQDVGNQLFCALLRAVGVETRLVCSLQSLPFNTTGQKLVTPQKQKPTVYADPDSEPASTTDGSVKGLSSEEPSRSAKKAAGPRQRRRIGQPSLGMPVGNYRQAPLPGTVVVKLVVHGNNADNLQQRSDVSKSLTILCSGSKRSTRLTRSGLRSMRPSPEPSRNRRDSSHQRHTNSMR